MFAMEIIVTAVFVITLLPSRKTASSGGVTSEDTPAPGGLLMMNTAVVADAGQGRVADKG